MTTKERLLALLEANKGTYFSGQELGRQLNLSRAAVWKAIGQLRQAGYSIDAVTNRGYCLSPRSDILSATGIAAYLGPGFTLEVVPTAVSTNALARQRAQEGAPEGYVLLSNGQTEGRGRYGRSFYSPEGTGIYLSLLLRPKPFSRQQGLPLTAMAAVAMCRAIATLGGGEAEIKWVNDIFLHGKKVCGILTEGAYDLESGTLETAVVGVGINLYPPQGGFPSELANTAGAVFPGSMEDGKNRMAAAFLSAFWECYQQGADFRGEYRSRSLVLGKTIRVSPGNRLALAVDLDEQCRLRVRWEDGTEQTLSSGEVGITLPQMLEKSP